MKMHDIGSIIMQLVRMFFLLRSVKASSIFRTTATIPSSSILDTQVFSNIPDTVPPSVECDKIKKCDHNHVCVIICARGSVVIPARDSAALRIQRQLAYSQPFCEAQLPGSHNSAITLADGYGLEDHVFQHWLKDLSKIMPIPDLKHAFVHTSDQFFSLTDQLRLGVRFLEIDVHWFDGDLRIAHCGGFSGQWLDRFIAGMNKIAKLFGSKIQWDSQTIGCKPSMSSIPASEQRHVESAIEEIADWIHRRENQDEFVILFFDDQSNLGKWHKVQQLIQYINNHFTRSELFIPLDYPHYSNQSSFPTIQSLLDQGKRLMLLSGEGYGTVQDTFMFCKSHVCQWSEPSLSDFHPFPICRFADDPKMTKLGPRLYRPESSEILYGPLNAEGHYGPNQGLLTEKTLPGLMACGINLPSPDNLTPERMEAMIWSFEPEEPRGRYPCTVMNVQSGKWKQIPCTRSSSKSSLPVACQDLEVPTLWTLGQSSNSFTDISKESCPRGYRFSIPKNGLEHEYLKRAVTTTLAAKEVEAVWLNLSTTVSSSLVYGDKGDFDDHPFLDLDLAQVS